eukprot:COSAG01_NODE_8543_length_2748_cov_1.661382_4_plen_133_part_00
MLDLGAHVGFFSLWCLDNGASSVVAVEAGKQHCHNNQELAETSLRLHVFPDKRCQPVRVSGDRLVRTDPVTAALHRSNFACDARVTSIHAAVVRHLPTDNGKGGLFPTRAPCFLRCPAAQQIMATRRTTVRF